MRWGLPESAPPRHPLRDTLIVYGALAAIIVLIAWATGGGIGRAVVLAVAFFVAATAWNAFHWRKRRRGQGRDNGRGPE